MINKIIPTVFSHNKAEFDEKFSKLINISKDIQIDFMDGKFVKAKSIAISQIPNLKKYKNNFEAHLMVKKPLKYIKKLKSKGFNKVIFHYNTDDNVKTIAEIRKNGMKALLALNPEVKVWDVCYLFQLVDGLLLMGVNPGKEHQKFISSVYLKIKEIRKIDKNLPIQIDGGVNIINIRRLAKMGVSIFNTGSFVSNAKKPKKALSQLRKEIN